MSPSVSRRPLPTRRCVSWLRPALRSTARLDRHALANRLRPPAPPAQDVRHQDPSCRRDPSGQAQSRGALALASTPLTRQIASEYRLRTLTGRYESVRRRTCYRSDLAQYEREYYDLIRSAFLKNRGVELIEAALTLL